MVNSCISGRKCGVTTAETPKPIGVTDSLALAWTDSVDLVLYRCTRSFVNDVSWSFYLMGEFHAYNAPSSRSADSVLARLQPALVLSEGAGDAANSSELMLRYGTAMRGLFGDIGYNEVELSRLAALRGIPVVWLEQMDTTTGVYYGTTAAEKRGLEQLIQVMETQNRQAKPRTRQLMKLFLENPEQVHRWLMSAMVKAGIDTARLQNMEQPESGIIDTRNQIMTARAIEYLTPSSGCVLIRFGDGHSDGMIEELGQHECTCEGISLRDFLMGGS